MRTCSVFDGWSSGEITHLKNIKNRQINPQSCFPLSTRSSCEFNENIFCECISHLGPQTIIRIFNQSSDCYLKLFVRLDSVSHFLQRKHRWWAERVRLTVKHLRTVTGPRNEPEENGKISFKCRMWKSVRSGWCLPGRWMLPPRCVISWLEQPGFV